ncbi:MAG TPA: SMC-Scp complex subunit ScpB [Anaerolineae bacterium]|nr:SMC-Scp complex subunit ScpB [Anaerolineae bacterium]HQH38902.1 SMC-Scp complex subunit ScpB [Anaerolineae bacterium]
MNEALPLSPDALLEALLFVAPQPLTAESLAEVAGLSLDETETALSTLEKRLATSGLRVQRHQKRLQIVSAPEAAPLVEKLLGLEVNLHLSQAALETLAIVGYAQPATRPQIEAIRGVGSDSVLRTLLAAGLIEEVGRADSVGRPILYGTTFEFLQQFGLQKPEDLPPLERPAEAPRASPVAAAGDDKP